MAKGDKPVPVASAKQSAPAAASTKKEETLTQFQKAHSHLFSAKKKNFGVGRDLQVTRDVSGFVRWPRTVRIQRQRAILKQRLKVPPSINMFTKTLEANQATTLFKLLSSYRPETKQEKRSRLLAAAKDAVKNQDQDPSKKPKVLKFGLNHITTLVEQRKAKLVVIAHDVDPIELVVWLPTLCRKMDVPFVIVKGKARLGALVHQKTAAVVALTDVRKEHAHGLEQLISNTRPMYNDAAVARKWGGGQLGAKAQMVIQKRAKLMAKEALSKQSKF